MRRMHGGQLQGERRQHSLYGVQHGLFLHGGSSYVLQRVRSGLLRNSDECEHGWMHRMRRGVLHKRCGLSSSEQLYCLRSGLLRNSDGCEHDWM